MIGSDVLGSWFLVGVASMAVGAGMLFGGWGLAAYGFACCIGALITAGEAG